MWLFRWLLTERHTGNWGVKGFSLIPLADLGPCEFVFRYVFSVCVWDPASGLEREKERYGLQKTPLSKNIFQLWPSALNGLAWELVFILYIYRILIPRATIRPSSNICFFSFHMHSFVFTQLWLLMAALTPAYRTKTECVYNQRAASLQPKT